MELLPYYTLYDYLGFLWNLFKTDLQIFLNAKARWLNTILIIHLLDFLDSPLGIIAIQKDLAAKIFVYIFQKSITCSPLKTKINFSNLTFFFWSLAESRLSYSYSYMKDFKRKVTYRKITENLSICDE